MGELCRCYLYSALYRLAACHLAEDKGHLICGYIDSAYIVELRVVVYHAYAGTIFEQLELGSLYMLAVVIHLLCGITAGGTPVLADVCTDAQEYVMPRCFLVQSLCPLIRIHTDEKFSAVHAVIVVGGSYLAAGIHALSRCLVLLVDRCLCHIGKIVVLLKAAIQLYFFMRSCLGHRGPKHTGSAYPVISIEIGIVELSGACGDDMQVCPFRHDLQPCYILLERCSTLLHAGGLIKSFGTYLQYLY